MLEEELLVFVGVELETALTDVVNITMLIVVIPFLVKVKASFLVDQAIARQRWPGRNSKRCLCREYIRRREEMGV